jgi:hypothetical protein
MMQKKRKFVFGLAAITLSASLTMLVHTGWTMDADDAPESVEISSLSKLYGPVAFDHAAHVSMAECSDCHHHTTGTGPANPVCGRCHPGTEEGDTVACTDCHVAEPFTHENLLKMENPEIFHIDKPGLKGAYHINCLGCHQQMDGPTGCQDCHTMTEAGEKRFDTGKYAPKGYKPGVKHHDAE